MTTASLFLPLTPASNWSIEQEDVPDVVCFGRNNWLGPYTCFEQLQLDSATTPAVFLFKSSFLIGSYNPAVFPKSREARPDISPRISAVEAPCG